MKHSLIGKTTLAACALLATSCTTAGPFVTSISSDGRGNLIVEKAMVQFNQFTGTVTSVEPSTRTIRLGIERNREPAEQPKELGER